MCPHPTSVATKKLLCGPQPTHVATTTSCWSSAYPCSYHNFLLVLSGSVKPKIPLLWSSQPTPVTKKEARWSSDYSCIIIALCVFLVYHSFHKKPVVLSQPFSHHIISSGPQCTLVAIKTPVATTASWWASVFPITAHYVV